MLRRTCDKKFINFCAMKYINFSWDFKNADTKQTTHCFHAYPAMMIV
jgi:hypothetical protein